LRNTSTKTDGWQSDANGNTYRESESGIRVYQMNRVDQVISLGQYFRTQLYQKYGGATLDSFQTSFDKKLQRNKKFAAAYVKRFEEIRDEGKGYYLHSQKPGSGKTMLACCILNGLSQRYEVTTQAISTISFTKRLKDTFSDEDTSENSVINPMLAVDVLLLDDCGSENHSEWVDEQLYHIIDSRLNRGKPTFFTANYTIDELPYHKRIKSRINAVTAQIAMPEKDIRAKVTKQNEKEFLSKLI
jgi:DNA replication protein DnaC